jgi:hypothetical protein
VAAGLEAAPQAEVEGGAEAELRRQRGRLKAAGRRRLAAARRDARALSWMRHSTAWLL